MVMGNIKETIKNRKLKNIFYSLENDIKAGFSLTAAFEKFEKDLGKLSVSMIKLGEETGDLARAVKDLSVILHEISDNRKREGLMSILVNENTSALVQGITGKITINENGEYYYQDTLIDLNTLKQTLESLKPDKSIILSVDKSVRFERFIQLIDVLKRYNLNNLSIATRPVS